MRPTPRHVKLGLLAALGVVAAVIVLMYLGLKRNPTDTYHSYFNESVQGLDEGAVVKYRGVRIGKVSKIRVAPDRRLIDVGLAVDRRLASDLRLRETALALRAQLVVFGITGVKLIDIDFADAQTPPPPPLAFRPAPLYIPSQPSLVGSLEDDVVAIARKLPHLIDRSVVTVENLGELAAKAGHLLDATQQAVGSIGSIARGAARANVPRTLAKTLGSVEDLGRRAYDVSAELENTLRDIGDAARGLRDFIDTLEREPDILLKGRARKGRRR